MPTIGVLSDTHGFLDQQIRSLFKGAIHILHAGDIGSPELLRELRRIAPVTAVSGNTDDPGFHYPPMAEAVIAGRTFLLQHIVDPFRLRDPLLSQIARLRPDLVVFGHTHKPLYERVAGTLFLNPGYSGRARFGLPRSVALLHLEPNCMTVESLPLSQFSAA